VNPDVAAAVAALEREGILPTETAGRLGRVARGELVSVRAELRLLAYTGVLLLMGGVGVLVKDNLERIGPLGIALGLAVGAGVCFAWIARRAAPFTPGESASTDLAFDYVLLLGALLAAADLAYVEAQFTPLGPAWAWHLLVVAVFYALLAFRYDSRVLFSLALSTFAAWRGVSAATLELAPWGRAASDVVRANALACGVSFVVAGVALRRRGFKAHFEPVAIHLGWLLVLGALVAGLGEDGFKVRLYQLAVLLVGAGLALYAAWRRRFPLFAIGVAGAYIGVTALVLHAAPGELWIYWFAFTPLGLLAALLFAHRFLKVEA